jgi:hypothetical protein
MGEMLRKSLVKNCPHVPVLSLRSYQPGKRMLRPTVFEFAPAIRERIPDALKKVSRLQAGFGFSEPVVPFETPK